MDPEQWWQQWRKGFDTWERSTADLFEAWMKSPMLLEPAGAMLTAMMRAKKQADDMTARMWALAGLPTRRDQERVLHALNQLDSRLTDLEERLEDAADPEAEPWT